eukprot:1339632-Amorphochlora_amoeboformis.AAC.1
MESSMETLLKGMLEGWRSWRLLYNPSPNTVLVDNYAVVTRLRTIRCRCDVTAHHPRISQQG